MRCCAEALLWVAILAAPVAAQEPDRVVAEAVAARWGVHAADVRVEPVRSASWPAEMRDVRVLGAGADGTWVVSFEAETGAASLIVRAGVERERMVAARDIARGAALSDADLTVRRLVQWGPPGSPTQATAGWILRRRVTAGEAIDESVASPPPAVLPGQAVRVVWESGTVSIAVGGRAGGRATVGERVAVRTDTGRRLEGIVIADGVVRVGPDSGRKP